MSQRILTTLTLFLLLASLIPFTACGNKNQETTNETTQTESPEDLVFIEGGTFQMEMPTTDSAHNREITISNFYMSDDEDRNWEDWEQDPTTFRPAPNAPTVKLRKRDLSWCPEKAVPTQRYTLNTDEDHVFRGQSGTLIQVPQHAFVDKKTGEPIEGEVSLLLREAYSKADLIKSGLPTRAGRRLLRSGGVIEIQAEANGKPCKLAKNKELYVEFVSENAWGDMCLWSGEQDAEGFLNWEEVAKAHKDMILFPLDVLDLETVALTQADLAADSARKTEKVYRRTFEDVFAEKLQDPQAQSSWLATREFRERLEALRKLGEGYDFADHYIKDHNGRLVDRDKKVLMELYNIRRTHEQGHGSEHLTALIEQYEKFVAQDKGYPEIIPDYGIDLSSDDAHEQLVAKGVDPQTADRYIAVQARTDFLQAELEKTIAKEAAELEKRTSKTITDQVFSVNARPESRGFSVSRLGLFNCDAVNVLRDPKEVALNIHHDNAKVWQYARCYIVIHRTNSFLELRPQGQGRFWDKDLPNRRSSTLVGLSYVDGQHYIAKADFKIGGQAPDLTLTAVSNEVVDAMLQELN